MKLKTIITLAITCFMLASCEPKVDFSKLSETGKIVYTLENAIGLKRDKAIENMSDYINNDGYVVVNELGEQKFVAGEKVIHISESKSLNKIVNCIIFEEAFDISTPEAIKEFNALYTKLSTELSLYHKNYVNYYGGLNFTNEDRVYFHEYVDFYNSYNNKSLITDYTDPMEQYFATKGRSTILAVFTNSLHNPHIDKNAACISIRVQSDNYPN